MTVQLKPLEPFSSKMNVFSGMRVLVDDNPNFQHWSGDAAIATGISPTKQSEFDSKTIDQTDRRRHLPRHPLTSRCRRPPPATPSRAIPAWAAPTRCRPKPSPLSLYTRLFGPGFQDPTKGDWKPDPQVMLQQSVLSAVAENRKDVMKNLGAADRARMEQYFTSVREAEMQMAAQLQRPEIQAKVDHSRMRRARCRVQQCVAQPAHRHAADGEAGRAGAGDRPDPGVQPQRLRTRLADLHAGRLAGLSPVHPRRADRSGARLSAARGADTMSTPWNCSPCC